MKKFLLVLGMTIFMLSSCILYQVPTKIADYNENIVVQSKDIVWNKTIQFLTKYKISPVSQDKISGSIKCVGTFDEYQVTKPKADSWDIMEKPILDCGTFSNNSRLYVKNVVIMIIITDMGNGKTKINIECDYDKMKATGYDEMAANMICYSTGNFEKDLYSFIEK
jgi:hypothetical protein